MILFISGIVIIYLVYEMVYAIKNAPVLWEDEKGSGNNFKDYFK